jgi:hypothetical protein
MGSSSLLQGPPRTGDMLNTLITSKTRLKLLYRFFLNPGTRAYLRGLAEEFGESSNSIRVELNRFEEAGLLDSETSGNKKIFKANTKHPLFPDIQNIVKKTIGIDHIVDKVVKNIGDVDQAYITGDFAMGRDGQTIDIRLVGNGINKEYLLELIARAEEMIKKPIRYLIMHEKEAMEYLGKVGAYLLIWKR